MEVLSCSEIQYVGELNVPQRNPSTKPSNRLEGEGTLLEIDYPEPMPEDDRSNGIFGVEGTLLKVDFPQQWLGDKQLKGHQMGASILQKKIYLQQLLEEPSNNVQNRDKLPNCIYKEKKKSMAVEEVNNEEDVKLGSTNMLLDPNFPHGGKSNHIEQLEQSHVSGMDDIAQKIEDGQKAEPSGENGRVDLTLETFHYGNFDPKHKEGEEEDYPEQDDTVALWVKWRGKWQAGIKCSRADCPLPTLKAKPTHGRKKYFVVFFPHTRIHSWADMLLVRPINEAPEPLAYGTHYSGMEMVKDLTIPQRYIMQKLAVAMLDISDQLHTEAVIERARKVTAWKEFAMEASRCEGYSDLGRMLLKLQSMIMVGYIAPDWLEHSFDSWAQRCHNAKSAESIEMVTEELVDSVLWSEVSKLWDEPVQPDLGSEWKTWKQEVMKWFSTSHPVTSGGDMEHRNCDYSRTVGFPISKKRPKLEVRRAETNASQVDVHSNGFLPHASRVAVEPGFFNCQDHENTTLVCKPLKGESLTSLAVPTTSRWDGTVIKNGLRNFRGITEKAVIPAVGIQNGSHSENKYRQCVAFIQAKGRQCGRWANDGGIYCCVHMNSRLSENAPKLDPIPSPSTAFMCEGTTNHGKKCKHRSRIGSPYCLKHLLQHSRDLGDSKRPSSSSVNKLKRKNGEKDTELSSCSEIALVGEGNLVGEDKKSLQEFPNKRNRSIENSENLGAFSTPKDCSPELPRCIGWCRQNNEQCKQRATLQSSYCEKHIPSWIQCGRKSKNRIISAEVFHDLLKNSSTAKQKVYLYRACELLHEFMKNSLSSQTTISKETYMEWILAEAAKDLTLGESLLKLVSREREKIGRIWGFDVNKGPEVVKQVSYSGSEIPAVQEARGSRCDVLVETGTMKCKLCSKGFSDDRKLGVHWMEVHKKEAQWLFRGYACPICKSSFTNKKVLSAHVKERHVGQVLEESLLLVCILCNSHFVDLEQLWLHVLSAHYTEFRLPQHHNHPAKATAVGDQANQEKLEISNKPSIRKLSRGLEKCVGNQDGFRKFTCRFCGLKFDLLPDLGRHHQAAHMGPDLISKFPPKRGTYLNVSKTKSGRLLNPRFKKGLTTALKIRNAGALSAKKHFQVSNSESFPLMRLQTQISGTAGDTRSVESYCSAMAEILFHELQKTKPRPSSLEILAVARSSCCRINLHAALEEKYGALPERLYLKAAKLCSELNVRVEWHQEGFVCPRGCKLISSPDSLLPLVPLPEGLAEPPSGPLDLEIVTADSAISEACEMDESHYILNYSYVKKKCTHKAVVLCEDLSFGREPVPVACVIDKDIMDSLHINSNEPSMPWKGFNYITERLLDPSLGLDTKSSQLGCACPHPMCYPETCDHVYLFENDYDNAEDIHGKPMHGRFPYDETGRIVLEEGYMVYECNSLCSCDKNCRNRVLQKGVQVKLEVYKTKNKGWAVRAGEAISRGTFVCEYLGEVLNDQEANKRGERYDNEGCSYLYDIDAHIDMSGLNEGAVPYVIDATKYGNVARFINHSCCPNLVNHQVLVESMDCQLAHIGLYASRDISVGEELAYDYRYKLLPGKGCPCHCGASNCRGRLY